jgi:Protein of unknown function (DUF1569)
MKSLEQPEVKAELQRRIALLEPGSSRRWGSMTAHQAVCHLTDSFKAVVGERNMTVRPMPALQQSFMKWFTLYVPIPWPQGIKTAPENDQNKGGTKPLEFARDKTELLEWIERIAARQVHFKPHPLMGDMSEREWLRWSYLHCDHHLRQFGV